MAKGKYKEWLTKEGLAKISAWARAGLIDEDIAHNMGVAPKTLYEWEKSYPQFCNAIKESKKIADHVVENALYKSAVGYCFDEVTNEIAANGAVSQKTVHKYVVPNVTAAIFWLKNREPDKWRDRQQVDLTVGGDIAELLKKRRTGNV